MTIAVCCPRVSSFTFSHLFLTAAWLFSEEETFKNLHFSICLKSAHGVSHIDINSSYTPLQYTAPDQTSAEVRPCQMLESQRGRGEKGLQPAELLRTPQSFYLVLFLPHTLLVLRSP